ncbi:MAG: hypothetical protein DYG98_14605 [Haliscomenobacteraceae bacterium CHB4]|nr:hypothetical protein [Saprospiraceae bacterium]MCE7924273.1 hypothetical protein [Haliscomenobacteraceae bacterium CHB4]
MKLKNGFVFTLFLIVTFVMPSAAQHEGPPSDEKEFEKQYQERIKKEKLNNVYIPKNLDDAMLQLDKIISPESQAKIKVIPEDSVCLALHRRLGQWMILNWGFYGGSRLSHYLRSAGVTFPDDMADFLILAYHRKLNGKSIEIRELAKYYREKRKKEFEEEKKQGKVIREETRKRDTTGNKGNK